MTRGNWENWTRVPTVNHVIKQTITGEVGFLRVDNHMQNTRGKMFCAAAHLRHLSGNWQILEITCGRKKDLKWGTGERKTAGSVSFHEATILCVSQEFSLSSSIYWALHEEKIKEETPCRLGVTLACYVSVNMFQVHAANRTNLA